MVKRWFHPGSNRGPSLRQSDVITNYTMKPNEHSNIKDYTRLYDRVESSMNLK